MDGDGDERLVWTEYRTESEQSQTPPSDGALVRSFIYICIRRRRRPRGLTLYPHRRRRQ